jgi:hypothetical protein
MIRKPMIAGAAAVVAVLVLGGLFAYLYDHSRSDVIAPGVRVAGIDVGGLHSADAFARLQSAVDMPLQQPLVVDAGARRFTLRAQDAGVTIDTRTLVAEALRVSRTGSFLSRTVRGLTGSRLATNLPLAVTGAEPDGCRRRCEGAGRPDRGGPGQPPGEPGDHGADAGRPA